MPLKAYWAYAFVSDRPLAELAGEWNSAGPWDWQLRDSSWYGDYLSARPSNGVRVRIHEQPHVQPGGYTAPMQIEPESAATQAEVDDVVRGLLRQIGVNDVRPIEPYD